MLYSLIALSGILSFISARSTFFPLKWAASLSWWGLFLYWLGADLLVDGSPEDIAIMLLLIFLGVGFALWGLVTRGTMSEVQEERIVGGNRQLVKHTTYNRKQSQSRTESPIEYQLRVRKALEAAKRNRR